MLCVQVHVNLLIAGAVVTFLSLLESYWRQTLVSSPREICCCLHLNLPLWVTNEGREAINLQGRGDHRLNERQDKRSMRVVTTLLKARHLDLMPKIVWHIKTLVGGVMDMAHQSDGKT